MRSTPSGYRAVCSFVHVFSGTRSATTPAIAASDERTTPARPISIPPAPTRTTATPGTRASNQIFASVVPEGSPSCATSLPCFRT